MNSSATRWHMRGDTRLHLLARLDHLSPRASAPRCPHRPTERSPSSAAQKTCDAFWSSSGRGRHAARRCIARASQHLERNRPILRRCVQREYRLKRPRTSVAAASRRSRDALRAHVVARLAETSLRSRPADDHHEKRSGGPRSAQGDAASSRSASGVRPWAAADKPRSDVFPACGGGMSKRNDAPTRACAVSAGRVRLSSRPYSTSSSIGADSAPAAFFIKYALMN